MKAGNTAPANPKNYSKKPLWVQCTGEAHKNEIGYDHCMVCIPYWGSYPICPECNRKLKTSQCSKCKQRYNMERPN